MSSLCTPDDGYYIKCVVRVFAPFPREKRVTVKDHRGDEHVLLMSSSYLMRDMQDTSTLTDGIDGLVACLRAGVYKHRGVHDLLRVALPDVDESRILIIRPNQLLDSQGRVRNL